ncbi:MAG: hypothetical protein H6673_01955 [Anaerolineales bacterium]|nr:hypothetical protein [Anaerolineales bacterium]
MTDPTSQSIQQAQQLTALNLNLMLQSSGDLTHMQLEDITEMANEVARVIPAGNVVKMVFSQLRSIRGRRVSDDETRRMLSLLNQGMATFLDKAAYIAFYSTPAILISGYQMLLKAAGSDPQAAFPHGAWQFYLEFGLREDTARHACETIGFQQSIVDEGLLVAEADQLAAWIMAVSHVLLTYQDMLSQEWHERLLLKRLGVRLGDRRLQSRWVARRPYGVPKERKQEYINYRREMFAAFTRENLAQHLSPRQVDQTIKLWHDEITLSEADRKSYLSQMSLLSMLEPGAFNDSRVPIAPQDAYVGVIYNNQYHLVPLLHNGKALDVPATRAIAAGILNTSPKRAITLDDFLIQVPRNEQHVQRNQLPSEVQEQLARLRLAPVLINWDQTDSQLPLAEIRRGRRGIGDHTLTLTRTTDSMVFDQSHIFFDAIWGMAIAEIITGEATRNIRMINGMPPIRTGLRPTMIDLSVSTAISRELASHKAGTPEISAEVELPIVPDINGLRRLLNQRNSELMLTINDFLILYRSLFNQYYQPSPHLGKILHDYERLGDRQHQTTLAVVSLIEETRKTRPAFLIPIDASSVNPSARIFPITYCPYPPWTEIGATHETTWAALTQYQNNPTPADWRAFNEQRTHYFEMLRMFGSLMARYKEIALEGKTMSIATLQILGSVPKWLQPTLRNIPDKIDILNDMLKGTEVFSNVGAVAKTSSLSRFITAKDDNQKKELCWGIMTRADQTMVISLRDFRKPVTALPHELGQAVTQDFLFSYAHGLHQYIAELSEIVKAQK